MNDLAPRTRSELVAAVRAERDALADDLARLDADQWAVRSLCDRWSVEEVVAHLTSAAAMTLPRWLASMIGARFDADLHNDRRLADHRGATPAETLDRFRALAGRSTPAGIPAAGWLGEVVVHAQDVRRPLGLTRTPSIEAATAVAGFFASRDFAVDSRTTVKGLRLEATDCPFTTGDGPLVRGTTTALVLAMARRGAYCDDLEGDGLPTLRERCAPTAR